jgi:CHAT domain-containing protein
VLRATQAALAARPAANLAFAGAGNPLPPPPGLPALPGTEAELAAVAALFPAGDQRVLIREQATREALLTTAETAAHVHLGCHGRFDPRDPLRSALLLSGGEITLREILAKPPFPAARLVVLSACQSAVTEAEVLPDEAVGLPAGLLQAGVPGVVGSLWLTDDLATLLLMVRFWELYRESARGGRPGDPARALAAAQRWLRDLPAGELRKLFHVTGSAPLAPIALEARARFAFDEPEEQPFANPAHWAPFVFLGA